MPQAVTFDGATALSAPMSNLPTSQQGMLSFCYRGNPLPGGVAQWIVGSSFGWNDPVSFNSPVANLMVSAYNNDTRYPQRAVLNAWLGNFADLNTEFTHGISSNSTTNMLFDGAWHNVIFAWDTSVPTFSAWFDGATVHWDGFSYGEIQGQVLGPAPFTPVFNGSQLMVGAAVPIRADQFGNPYTGDLAELYVDVGPYDFIGNMSNANRARFWTSGYAPPLLDANGFPFGNRKPTFLLFGDDTTFPTSNLGQTKIIPGTPAPANTFSAAAGSIITAGSDPYTGAESVYV